MQADDLSGEGLCRHRNGELQRACDYYSRVVAERPDHFLALNNAALIAWDFGRIEMALTLLSETENTNQQLLELATVRSDQYLLLGPANDARPLLERSINIQPKNSRALSLLAVTFNLLGDRKALLACVEQHAEMREESPNPPTAGGLQSRSISTAPEPVGVSRACLTRSLSMTGRLQLVLVKAS